MSTDAQLKRLTTVFAKQFRLTPDILNASLIRASTEHIKDVSHMRRLVFKDEIQAEDEQYLQWRYFSRGAGDEPSNLWVFRYQGNIIGAVGTDPTEISVNGQPINAVRCMDAIIHPDYDGKGLGAWMNLKLQAMFDIVIAVGANDNSIGMLHKLFKPMPIRQSFKYPIRFDNYFRARLKPPLLAQIAAYIPNLYLAVRLAIFHKRSHLPKDYQLAVNSLNSDIIASLPEASTGLAEISAQRSRDYIRWRYLDNPRNQFRIVTATHHNVVQGYALFCVKFSQGYGRLEGYIMDWGVGDEQHRELILQHLFMTAVVEIKRENAEVANLVLNDSISSNCAKRIGFIWRNTDSRYFVHAQAHIDSKIYDAERWFYSQGETDGI